MASAAISASCLVQFGADDAERALDVIDDLLLGRLAQPERVQPFQDLELDVFEVRAALVQRDEVTLQGNQVLGQAGAAVELRLVAFDPGRHLLHVRLGALELKFGVVDGHLRATQLAVRNTEGGFKIGDPGVAFKGQAAVGQGLELRVESLQFEQLQLFRRCCLGHYYLRLFPSGRSRAPYRRLVDSSA